MLVLIVALAAGLGGLAALDGEHDIKPPPLQGLREPAPQPSEDGGTQPSPKGSDRVSGSDRDYLDAICQPGGFVDGMKTLSGMFKGSTGGGICIERRAGGPDVYLTQWDRDSGGLMANTMEALAMCYVAVNSKDHTKITAISVVSDVKRAPSLGALTQFGIESLC